MMHIDRLLTTAACSTISLTLLLAFLAFTEKTRIVHSSALRNGKEIEIGATLYNLNCHNCHGVRGEGVGQLGPPLADRHFFSDRLKEVGWQATHKEYIISTTAHGRFMGTRPIYAGNGSTAVMPPWLKEYGGPLREDEIHSLAAFITNWEATALGKITLTPLALPPENQKDPKLIIKGEQVFQQSCARCHSYRQITVATTSGPDLSQIAIKAASRVEGLDSSAYIRESLLVPEAYITDGYSTEAEKNPCGGILTITELSSISAFLLQ